MTFQNSILAGEDLVRTGIRSPNYVPGDQGWRIARDGSAEFANALIRGILETGAAGDPHIRVIGALIELYTGDPAETFHGLVFVDSDGIGPSRTATAGIVSPQLSAGATAGITVESAAQDGSTPPDILARLGTVEHSLGLGRMGGAQTNIAALGVTTGTSGILSHSADFITGRRYSFPHAAKILVSGASAWRFEVRVNGVAVAEIWEQSGLGALTTYTVVGAPEWTATATGTFTVDIIATRTGGAAGTFDYLARASGGRYLTTLDEGT
jgi:hypothetical protein